MTNAPTLPDEPQSWMMTEYIVDGTERHKCHCRVVSELAYSNLRDQLAAETARADANEKALKRIRAGLSNTPVCCGNPIDGHPGNYWEPPDAPECCREPDMLHDIIDAALAKS